jgi:hypothetical protein
MKKLIFVMMLTCLIMSACDRKRIIQPDIKEVSAIHMSNAEESIILKFVKVYLELVAVGAVYVVSHIYISGCLYNRDVDYASDEGIELVNLDHYFPEFFETDSILPSAAS